VENAQLDNVSVNFRSSFGYCDISLLMIHNYEYLSTLSATSLLINNSDKLIGKSFSIFHSTDLQKDSPLTTSFSGVVYASTLSIPRGRDGGDVQRLNHAVAHMLDACSHSDSKPAVLWSMKYRTQGRPIDSEGSPITSSMSGRVMIFPPSSIDIAFDDCVLEDVKEVWKRIMGGETEESDFLKFEGRGVDVEDNL
jgi:hypothetical protein